MRRTPRWYKAGQWDVGSEGESSEDAETTHNVPVVQRGDDDGIVPPKVVESRRALYGTDITRYGFGLI